MVCLVLARLAQFLVRFGEVLWTKRVRGKSVIKYGENSKGVLGSCNVFVIWFLVNGHFSLKARPGKFRKTRKNRSNGDGICVVQECSESPSRKGKFE